MERHLLVVMPHPDDETLASGGTIALHAKEGTPVTYLCGTLGEMGRNMGKPPFATRESLPALREKELREACRELGITDLRLMGLRDKLIEFLDQEELARRIKAVIEEVRPSLIITYHPTHSVHPDHMSLGAATVRAVEMLPPEQRPTVHCRAFGKDVEELGEPDVTVDISAVLDRKMAAARAHRSQTQGMMERMQKDPEMRKRLEVDRSIEKYWIWRFA